MNDACTRKPEGGKLTASLGGEIITIFKEIFHNGFLSYNGFITDFLGFWCFWPILTQNLLVLSKILRLAAGGDLSKT